MDQKEFDELIKVYVDKVPDSFCPSLQKYVFKAPIKSVMIRRNEPDVEYTKPPRIDKGRPRGSTLIQSLDGTFSVKEAMAFYNIEAPTVYRWLMKGKQGFTIYDKEYNIGKTERVRSDGRSETENLKE
jgi:hypothetical protein